MILFCILSFIVGMAIILWRYEIRKKQIEQEVVEVIKLRDAIVSVGWGTYAKLCAEYGYEKAREMIINEYEKHR